MSLTLTREIMQKHQSELTREEMAEIVHAMNSAPAVVTQARRAYPRNERAQRHFERGFYAELTGARDGLTGSAAENVGRAACRAQFGLPAIDDGERQLLALRIASPLRTPTGRDQADAAHLPLFIAANEPVLL